MGLLGCLCSQSHLSRGQCRPFTLVVSIIIIIKNDQS